MIVVPQGKDGLGQSRYDVIHPFVMIEVQGGNTYRGYVLPVLRVRERVDSEELASRGFWKMVPPVQSANTRSYRAIVVVVPYRQHSPQKKR